MATTNQAIDCLFIKRFNNGDPVVVFAAFCDSFSEHAADFPLCPLLSYIPPVSRSSVFWHDILEAGFSPLPKIAAFSSSKHASCWRSYRCCRFRWAVQNLAWSDLIPLYLPRSVTGPR